MRNVYQSLTRKDKALVWIAGTAVVVLMVSFVDISGAGLVAGAQIVAAFGTLALAALAYMQVGEMRAARKAQERPQIIVEADYSRDPLVSVVVRNIGKGAAKDIEFEFSAPMISSFSEKDSGFPPVNELLYFEKGLDYLAPGAEVKTLWDSYISLKPLLEEKGPKDGFTVISRYRSLDGEYHETPWAFDPLRMGTVEASEIGIKDLVKSVEGIRKDLHRVVSPANRELKVSTESEREERKRRRDEDEGRE